LFLKLTLKNEISGQLLAYGRTHSNPPTILLLPLRISIYIVQEQASGYKVQWRVHHLI